MSDVQLLSHAPLCYAVFVVRGSPNPRHWRLAARIRMARKQRSQTRMATAEKAGVSESSTLYIETGKQVPTVGTLARLAHALAVSASWLAYGLGEQAEADVPSSADGMAERLQAIRTERELTKAALAERAGLSSGAILGIERGGQAGVDTVEALAKVLRVSPAWLAFGVGPRELPPRQRAHSAPSPAP